MDTMLNQFSYNTRKSRSALIEEALEQYFTGIIEEGHEDERDRLTIIEERLEKLESEIQNIQRPDSSNQKISLSNKREGGVWLSENSGRNTH